MHPHDGSRRKALGDNVHFLLRFRKFTGGTSRPVLSPDVSNLPNAAPVFNPASGTIYITGLNINFIVEENTSVDFFMFGANGNVEATLSGYLVDK